MLKPLTHAAPPAATKRKASDLADDCENVDPSLSSKRAKGPDAFPAFTKDAVKPSLLLKPKATSTSNTPRPRARPALTSKSPISKLNTSVSRPPLSAPAGRSPTRGKRAGISRRRASGFARVDPPSFGASAVPFSLDAALKGTIPSYASRAPTPAPAPTDETLLSTPDMKSSWFFDIHEDTPDQEMTNLLQHSTCILDISSDEESAARARDDRGKENVPPADDVSQTARRAAARRGLDEMVVEKERAALKEMDVGEFYGVGCDASSVFVVPADEEEGKAPEVAGPEPKAEPISEPVPEKAEAASEEVSTEVSVATEPVGTPLETKENATAAVLEPMEGTGESFELWESGSAKGEADPPSPAPIPEA